MQWNLTVTEQINVTWWNWPLIAVVRLSGAENHRLQQLLVRFRCKRCCDVVKAKILRKRPRPMHTVRAEIKIRNTSDSPTR